MYLLISPLADIDDMHICYVLRSGDNATSDIFHFSLEDNGKSFWLSFWSCAMGCDELLHMGWHLGLVFLTRQLYHCWLVNRRVAKRKWSLEFLGQGSLPGGLQSGFRPSKVFHWQNQLCEKTYCTKAAKHMKKKGGEKIGCRSVTQVC